MARIDPGIKAEKQEVDGDSTAAWLEKQTLTSLWGSSHSSTSK
jgi:hypothetical protein